ncbi:MAG TPA: hypothetical protein VMY78_18075 [Solirubrobacteraceae bacterium]|nr:hypothetical protein [Solirubrobacteraceae bacterium]
MIFSLEALQADHGDCLLLHAGTAEEPLLVLVDGGPSGIYERSLRPRLEELRAQRAPDGRLRIDLAMVSHIDDDHVHGMVDLAAALVELQDDKRPLPYDVRTLWHNAFDDVVDDDDDELRTAALEILSEPVADARADELRRAGLAIVASVGQGRRLRDDAGKLGWRLNAPFQGPVQLPATGVRRISLDDTTLTVICPHAEQLERLREAWDDWLKEHPKAVARDAAATAAFVDNSPYNLSSIVVLAEAGGKSMLLTGDARGDHVLAGLDEAGVAKGGETEVDILKLPHHGSIRNLAPEFFARVKARHYVISANGRDGNPETETLETIVAAREGDTDYEIHLTNRGPKGDLEQRLEEFLAAKEQSGAGYTMSFRDPHALSLRIDLLEEP